MVRVITVIYKVTKWLVVETHHPELITKIYKYILRQLDSVFISENRVKRDSVHKHTHTHTRTYTKQRKRKIHPTPPPRNIFKSLLLYFPTELISELIPNNQAGSFPFGSSGPPIQEKWRIFLSTQSAVCMDFDFPPPFLPLQMFEIKY